MLRWSHEAGRGETVANGAGQFLQNIQWFGLNLRAKTSEEEWGWEAEVVPAQLAFQGWLDLVGNGCHQSPGTEPRACCLAPGDFMETTVSLASVLCPLMYISKET